MGESSAAVAIRRKTIVFGLVIELGQTLSEKMSQALGPEKTIEILGAATGAVFTAPLVSDGLIGMLGSPDGNEYFRYSTLAFTLTKGVWQTINNAFFGVDLQFVSTVVETAPRTIWVLFQYEAPV